jgi:hypothetical protein
LPSWCRSRSSRCALLSTSSPPSPSSPSPRARPAWPTTRPFASSKPAAGLRSEAIPGPAAGRRATSSWAAAATCRPSTSADGFLTIAHEIGHALGLKHGHETDNHGALTADRNSNEFSIMTYASYIGSHPPPITAAVDGSSAQNYMMYDMAALQVLYGANWDKIGSGETYSWDAGTGQQSINGRAAPFTGTSSTQKILTTVWTQGAAATYDLRNFAQDQIDDLRPGHWLTFSNDQLADLNNQLPDDAAYKAKGNVYNALLYQGDLRSAIADLITGVGNDTLIGNDRDNKLMGGDGIDILVANGGNDTLVGGLGADKIHFGPGSSVARETWATSTATRCSTSVSAPRSMSWARALAAIALRSRRPWSRSAPTARPSSSTATLPAAAMPAD